MSCWIYQYVTVQMCTSPISTPYENRSHWISFQRDCPSLTLAVFPSAYFVSILEYYIKKKLDGNAKMHMNSKNAYKKNLCAQLSRIHF